MGAERDKVDPVEWFTKVERLEADLRDMTQSRDDWQRRYREMRQERESALKRATVAEATLARIRREMHRGC